MLNTKIQPSTLLRPSLDLDSVSHVAPGSDLALTGVPSWLILSDGPLLARAAAGLCEQGL